MDKRGLIKISTGMVMAIFCFGLNVAMAKESLQENPTVQAKEKTANITNPDIPSKEIELEKYVRKELITFTWGNGDYQLGSTWKKYLDDKGNYIGPEDAWSHSRGPDKIIINKKGEVFIGDWLNNRTVIFNLQNNKITFSRFVLYSAPMCFDEDGNLYICEGKISKFDSQLKFVEEIAYEPLKSSEFKPKYISIGKNRNFYIFSVQRDIILINPKDKKIKKQIGGRNFKFLPATRMSKKSLVEIKEKVIDGVINEKRIKVVPPQSLKEIEIDLNVKGRYAWVSEIIGQDKWDNIFLLVGVAPSIGEVREKGRYIVQVYNCRGEFLTEISLDKDDRLHFDQEYLLTIDDEGNIYHLWIQREGPKLIKWEKV